ncbi:MAG: hypothetical protein E7614_08465 [Ruminococcaceae bacterium]|nr:hypothetical protein [Oscillospiraceae bacterium]
MSNAKDHKSTTKSEKKNQRRLYLTLIISLFIAFSLTILGIVLNHEVLKNYGDIPFIICIVSIISAILLFVVNFALKKRYTDKINQMNAAEIQNYFLSHRENAEETARKQISVLKKIRICTNIYSVFIVILASFISLLSNTLSSYYFLCTYLSAFLFFSVLSRIKLPYIKELFDEDFSYVSEKEFPHLYSIAKRAASTVGCLSEKEEIRIAILPDSNAGIAHMGKIYSVQIGSILLNTLTEEELFCIMLHEFSHIIWENKFSAKESRHYLWLSSYEANNSRSWQAYRLFTFPDTIFLWNFEMFRYASSLSVEEYADRAMSEYGNKETAASALIKITYHDFYCWEEGTYDEESPFVSEEIPNDFHSNYVKKFKSYINDNSSKWNVLISSEILSRNAYHPTTKMRLESLGVKEIKTVEFPSSNQYTEEAEKALKHSDSVFSQYNEDFYKFHRENYLKSLDTVSEWEEAGKPVVMEEYYSVVDALRTVGKNVESIEVCDRAIETLPNPALNYAYYMKGNFLLHQYDDSGLELIYKAMENHNYIDEGLEMIGRFCCMTGKQKELDEYREKAVILAQEMMDKYQKLEKLEKNDNLTSETLPDGLFEEIMNFISTIEKGEIEKIYLVRKTVTKDFFASVFVIKFFSNAKNESEIMEKIFSYLDTCSSHQFCLFDYDNVSYIDFESIENSCVYNAKT